MALDETRDRADAGHGAFGILLGAIILVLPFSVQVATDGSGGSTRIVKLPVADLGLWIAAGVGAILGLRRGWAFARRLSAPLAVVGIGLLASVPRLDSSSTASEIVQRLDYFLVAFVLVVLAPRKSVERTLVPLLGCAAFAWNAVGLWQVFVLGEPPWRVTSAFENRHLFGAFSAVASAVVIGSADRGSPKRWGLPALLALTSLPCATTLLPLIGVGVGTFVASAGTSLSKRLVVGLATSLAAFGLFGAAAPAGNVERAIQDWSVRDVETVEALHQRGAEVDALRESCHLFTVCLGAREFRVSTPNVHPRVVPLPDRRREQVFEPGYVSQRILEWQAALNSLDVNPVLGTGLGSYQRAVSAQYSTFRKLKTLEDGSQSGFAVEAVETGLAGLLVMAAFILAGLTRSAHGMASVDASAASAAHRGATAGIVAGSAAAFAVPVFQTPIAALFVMLVAVTLAPRRDFDDRASASPSFR
jgi:hypothetical protein